jgi:hypothetical protein
MKKTLITLVIGIIIGLLWPFISQKTGDLYDSIYKNPAKNGYSLFIISRAEGMLQINDNVTCNGVLQGKVKNMKLTGRS